MAIAKSLKNLARKGSALAKKAGGRAIKVSKKAPEAAKSALKGAKNIATKATTKLKAGVDAAKRTRTAELAKDKAQRVVQQGKAKVVRAAKKVSEKTPESVKKAARTTAKVARKAGETAGDIGAATVVGGTAAALGAAAPLMAGGAVAGQKIGQAARATRDFAKAKMGKKVKFRSPEKRMGEAFKDSARGAVAGVGAGVLGAGALTASIIKSGTPKEAEYNVTRLRDGRFSTQFKDKNSNVVFSARQLSSEDTDKVRSYLAVLDSIVLSDNPQKRRNEFLATVQILADQYKISNVSGNNLSLIIPNVEGGVQVRRRV